MPNPEALIMKVSMEVNINTVYGKKKLKIINKIYLKIFLK